MIIKRYIVNNMNEGLTRIRYELGKDAVIISQRKIRKPGIKGIFSKKVIEITAAVESVKKTDNDEMMQNSLEVIRKIVEKEEVEEQVAEHVESNTTENEQENEHKLYHEMHEMKEMMSGIIQYSKNGMLMKSELEQKLEEYDVSIKAADKIMNRVRSMDNDLSDIEKAGIAIEDMVSVSGNSDMRGTIILVGPTGVGKTTTIAKLAGKLALVEKKKVGLITIDTYRIGAVEQLKTYADIMNIPFKVVITIKEMEAAVESMKDCDVILIDTTGRSSKNTMQISELRAFIDKVESDSINLVLSCTTKNKDIETITQGYNELNYTDIIITKLDETTTYGSILNILEAGGKPLSFLTTGQNVPDDIKTVTPKEIASLILGEDSIC